MGLKRKQFERKAGLFGFLLAEKALLNKSVEAAERSGEKMGMLAYRLSHKHRNRALSNLELAFPAMPAEEREELAKRTFRHFGRTAADFVRSQLRTDEEVLSSSERIGFENIVEALKKGCGGIIMSGHLGNWERAAHAIAAEGHKLTIVVRDTAEEGLNAHVLRIRKIQGIEVLSKGAAARGIFKKLKANELVGILPDQNSGDLFVPFFGKPCGTVNSPAVIHARTGAAILPMFSSWIAPGRYRIEVKPPLQQLPGYEQIEGITRAINLSLEAAIRETPEQWLWLHDRWKSARQRGLI